jgi:hypothetical protein
MLCLAPVALAIERRLSSQSALNPSISHMTLPGQSVGPIWHWGSRGAPLSRANGIQERSVDDLLLDELLELASG